MREQVGIVPIRTAADPVMDLQTTAGGIEKRDRDTTRAALLHAAGIRALRIIQA
jgi:hypothetical protein